MKLLIYPDKFLRTIAKPVDNICGNLVQTIEDMKKTMIECEGLGLASTQVGIDQRIFTYFEQEKPKVIINPEVVYSSGIIISNGEGCLSLPGIKSNLARKSHLVIKGLDIDGKEFEMEVEGLMSILFQHEIDHLNGTLFIDHFSSLKRKMYEKKLKKKIKRTK